MSTPPKYVGKNANFGTIQVKDNGKIENASVNNVGNKSTTCFYFTILTTFSLINFDFKFLNKTQKFYFYNAIEINAQNYNALITIVSNA